MQAHPAEALAGGRGPRGPYEEVGQGGGRGRGREGRPPSAQLPPGGGNFPLTVARKLFTAESPVVCPLPGMPSGNQARRMRRETIRIQETIRVYVQ